MLRRILLVAVVLWLVASPAMALASGGVVYKLFDWGTDPNFGAVLFVYWDSANPSRGVYNWDRLDAALSKIEAQTLPEGRPKPAQVFIQFYESPPSPIAGVDFTDRTPPWVYAGQNRPIVGGRPVGHVLEACGKRAVIPAYDSAVWRNAYFDMVRAFAAHVEQYSSVQSIVVSVGVDSETQPIKDWYCSWKSELHKVPGLEYAWGGYNPPWRHGFVFEAMDVYREAFPDMDLYIASAPGGEARMFHAEYAANLGIGLKHAGGQPDGESAQGHGTMTGSWDPIARFGDAVNIWTESTHDIGAVSWRYWALLFMLHFHPAQMSLHGGFFRDMDPTMLGWVQSHLNVTAETAPSAWLVMRDSEFPLQGSPSRGVSGLVGNFEFYLTQTNTGDTPRVARPAIPASARDHDYSRQARRGQVFGVRLDPVFAARADRFSVTVTYLDIGTGAWSVAGQTAYRANTGAWQKATFSITHPEFAVVSHGDDLYLHRIDVVPAGMATPTLTIPTILTITPTATRTATPTHTYTPTPTVTPTRTMTPTRTVVPVTLTPTPRPRTVELVCQQLVLYYDDGSVQIIEGECIGGGR